MGIYDSTVIEYGFSVEEHDISNDDLSLLIGSDSNVKYLHSKNRYYFTLKNVGFIIGPSGMVKSHEVKRGWVRKSDVVEIFKHRNLIKGVNEYNEYVFESDVFVGVSDYIMEKFIANDAKWRIVEYSMCTYDMPFETIVIHYLDLV